jgi:hypothetical protein
VVVSIALAAGCFSAANALAEGSERQLVDKAAVYVGSDLQVDVFDDTDLPATWTAPTTRVSKISVKWDQDRADVWGVDIDTFASAAMMRADGAGQSLDELVAQVTPAADHTDETPLPAIAVDAGLSVGDHAEVLLPGGQSSLAVEIVTVAEFFPGMKSGVPMFVVDGPSLEERFRFATSALLVRDPPAAAVESIRASGIRTGVVLDADSAFDGSAYSALRWAYAPLATLGALFAVVALALQLLVIAARRRQRQIADVVMRRTGFGRRQLWWASVVETGVAMLVGTATGVGASVVAVSLAIERLDPMPALAPPAEFTMPWGVLLAIAAAVPLWTAAMAAVIVRSTTTRDPMAVMQGAV